MISAWARMCKILGDQFVQYLPVVMKPVLQAAKMKPEVAIIDCKCICSSVCCMSFMCVSVCVCVLYVTVHISVSSVLLCID